MVEVRLTANAANDLLEIATFMGPSLSGENFFARFADAMDLLSRFPEAGRQEHPRNRSLRYLVVRDYMVNYEVTVDGVVIRSVIHGARVRRRRR